MALIKGVLASFDDPLLGVVPTMVAFQYNPTEVTRVFRSEVGETPAPGAALNAARPTPEDYSVKLGLDATDGLEIGGPLTTAFGIAPRLAAIEMLMQPVGSSLLGSLIGGGGASVPAARLPLVLFIWGPGRVTPVRLKSLTIHETAFDELLNPIHASADLGFAVLRLADLGKDEKLARAAAAYYQGAREVKAALSLPQMLELDASPLDPTSRYAGLPTIAVTAADGSVRQMVTPRIVPAPPLRGSYVVRAGDRLDLLGGRAFGDSTRWWVLADANPWADATLVEEPSRRIELPDV